MMFRGFSDVIHDIFMFFLMIFINAVFLSIIFKVIIYAMTPVRNLFVWIKTKRKIFKKIDKKYKKKG